MLLNASSIDGKALADIVKLLISAETAPGGPYQTWLTPRKSNKWHDIDPAVNANVAYFLSLQDIALPALIQYVEDCIKHERYSSRYYFSPIPIAYFISRWYRGNKADTLAEYIQEKFDVMDRGREENALFKAMAVSSLA